MPYIEITLELSANFAQGCTEQMENLGALAVSYFDAKDEPVLEPKPGETPLWDHIKVVGLFSEDCDPQMLSEALKKSFPTHKLSIASLPDQEWTRTWLEHFQPILFGRRLWVVPLETDLSTLNAEIDAVFLKLDPGLAFGTGTHPTTALCLQWLEANPPKNKTVMDYGCGSGILAIAALLLGAKKVFAIDYDPQALISTADNLQKNNLDPAKCAMLLPEQLPSPAPKVQLILANILAEPLIELAPALAKSCEINGKIILSGLLTSQIEMVKSAYSEWFDFDEATIQDDWVLLCATRK